MFYNLIKEERGNQLHLLLQDFTRRMGGEGGGSMDEWLDFDAHEFK